MSTAPQMGVSTVLTETLAKLRSHYGCGPVEFAGTDNGLPGNDVFARSDEVFRVDL